MSQQLKQLVTSSNFLILHDKLEQWFLLYDKNTCDENIARGCDIIEMNSRLHSQLIKILMTCASEGGIYGGIGTIKSRLLPLLEAGCFHAGQNMSLQNSSKFKSAEAIDSKHNHFANNQQLHMETEQDPTNQEKTGRKSEQDTGKSDRSRPKRNNKKNKPEENALEELKLKLEALEQENAKLKNQIVRKSITGSEGRKSPTPVNQSDLKQTDDYPENHLDEPISSSAIGGVSPLSQIDPIQNRRQQLIVMRWNDLFSGGRIEAMGLLRRYLDDSDMNQTIVFQTMMEAFNVVKAHYCTYRNRVRTKISTSSNPPSNDTLEEMVQSHINVHGAYAADLSGLAREVYLAMERHVPRIRRPSTALGFEVIGDFVYQVCRIAWDCSILAHPLDVFRPVCVGEVIDDTKYRRSHDSTYSTVLIHHHIWPCLIQDRKVISKGEVCTKRRQAPYGNRRMSSDARGESDRVNNRTNARSSSPMHRSPSSPNYKPAAPEIRSRRSYHCIHPPISRTLIS